MSDLESRYQMTPSIEWYIKTIKGLINEIEKIYKNKSRGLHWVDMELDTIIHRAYEFKVCLRCQHKDTCTGLCIDAVDFWGDFLLEDADKINESRAWRYGD